ncbi:MAG: preprotein translocase subunit SecA [Armatimonadaceae bacterium]
MLNFFKTLFDSNERDIKRYRKAVEQINALEPQFEKLTDEELRGKTEEFRERFRKAMEDQGGEEALEAREKQAAKYTKESHVLRDAINNALDQILPEAFAACREASKRILGMRHFDVQLIGGMVQHDGRIAELRTGEGKTLVSTLATYLNAIAGRGVHIVTVNDYLVRRDAVWMGPLYHSLGLTVGILQGASPETGEGGGTFLYDPEYEDPSVDGLDSRFKYSRPIRNRKEAYLCDITYGTSSEFGFDYLRDNMAPTLDYVTQARGHHFAIVDECDSNLIDEARTPLIISAPAEKPSEMYYLFARIIPSLERGKEKKDKYDTETDEKDYTVDERAKSATFTEQGLEKVEKALRASGYEVDEIAHDREAMQYATAALKAHAVFEKDKDYVVRPNQEGKPEVVIVDEFTGRLMFGRRWSDGLHQAVEAKEGIRVENESQTLATITIQNYFRMYRKLAGMTGTAKTEEDEFRKIYGLDVVQVPTNRPVARQDLADVIYKTEEAKMRGIAADLLRLYCRQQPVLVGTRSIEMSERVSSRLTFQALETLACVQILRYALEEKRNDVGEKYAAMSETLNTRLDQLNHNKLIPVAKELGVSIKVLDRDQPGEAFDRVMALFEIEDSGRDYLVEALQHGIPHNILNAKYHEQEARIIAEAGRKGAVTIATNMAGRGVDILLGGTHHKEEDNRAIPMDTSYRRGGKRHAIAHVVGKTDQADDPESLGPAGAGTIALEDTERLPDDVVKERAEVKDIGGLYVLGTERHESRRIDNQLRGRSGRQGDPGASRFHVSLEDYLWRVFGDRSQWAIMKGWEEDQAVDIKFLSNLIERAQKKVEQHNFNSRKHVLEYDDVMNVQREVIYKERRKILEGANLKDTLLGYLHDAVDSGVHLYCSDTVPEDEWDRKGLYDNLNQQFPLAEFVTLEDIEGMKRDSLLDRLHEAADEAYAAKENEWGEDVMRDIERQITMREIDQGWVHHLADMEFLREGIGLRGYAQVDPLVAYKKEAQELFERFLSSIQGEVVRKLFQAQVQMQPEQMTEEELLALMNQMGLQGFEQLEGVTEGYEGEEGIPVDSPVSAPRAPVMPPPPDDSLLAAALAASQQKSQAPAAKAGPNDPCPCGSGKKYKRCCRNK